MRNLRAIALAGLLAATCGSSKADILFQTHENASDRHGSVSIFSGNFSSLGNPQWLGARFVLNAPAHVDGIGADFDYVKGTIFGAIIRLPSPFALPSGDPFTPGSLVAEVTIDGGNPIYAIDADLGPGAYGLVFGSGYFGTQGFSGIFSTSASNPAGTFFAYGNSASTSGPFWFNAGFDGTQFTVTGTGGHAGPAPAPEPTSWALMLIGFMALGAGLRSRRTAATPF